MATPFFFEVTTTSSATQLINVDFVQLVNSIPTGPDTPDRAQLVMADGTLVDVINTYAGVRSQLTVVVP